MAAISDGETAKIAHVYIGTYDGQLTADSENRDSQQYCKFPIGVLYTPISKYIIMTKCNINYINEEINKLHKL